jgi:hypothetical protein
MSDVNGAVEEMGFLQRSLVGLFGRSYDTSIAGAVAGLGTVVVALSAVLPQLPHNVVAVAGVLAGLATAYLGRKAKSVAVTGVAK